MNRMSYVSLHHHSTWSFMDGHGTVQDHVRRVAELGYSALALTEHGNTSSHPQLEKEANKAGIKPIFGLEAYTETPTFDSTGAPIRSRRKFHLTLLAMDDVGYRSLMRIVTASWENYYQWPTVSGKILADNSDGIIVLSGCSDSLLACSLLGGKTIDPADASYDRAKRQALKFKELLGDRFYLETQMFPELERSRHINADYERMGDECGIPLVATADCHYPHPDDNEMQVILHAAGRGAGSVAAQEASWEYDIRLAPPTNDSVIMERLVGAGLSKRGAAAALDATTEIAARCNVVLPKAERLRFPVGQLLAEDTLAQQKLGAGATSLDLIWHWMREGWAYRARQGNKRMADPAQRPAYQARIKHEMGQIADKDFVDYFLMLSDLVRAAKDAGIPVGPARGSAAASLVAYLLRITEIDPLEYPLMMFDRFIDPTRTDLPDVDLDFDDERRSEVRDLAVKRYGDHRVANVANYVKYRGKNSIDDVARVYRIPKYEAEALKGMVVERSGGDSRADQGLVDTIGMFANAKAIVDRHPDLMKATRLEGNYRGMSVHAAGLVIGDTDITNVCAMYSKRYDEGKPTERCIKVASVDKYDAEYLGLLKADFLGLSTMGMIRMALEMADLTLEDLYRVPMDDTDTLAAFERNDVLGIFQWEGRATRLVNKEVKPTTFEHLTHVNTLSRPGPLFSGTTSEYIEVHRGNKTVTSYHPIIDEITKDTRGLIIFQEQILKGLAQFGGLAVGRVHEIRRIISKKLGEAQFNTHSKDFIANAVRLHGVSEKTAQDVWGRLVTAASYVFCCTGDTVVEKGGAGWNRATGLPNSRYATLEELYEAQEGDTAVGAKMRDPKRGINLIQMDDDGVLRPARLLKILPPVMRPLLRVRTESGHEFRCSIGHNLLTGKGYRDVKDLKVDDELVVDSGMSSVKQAPKFSRALGRSILRSSQRSVAAKSGGRCQHCGIKGSGGSMHGMRGHSLEFAHIVTLVDLHGDARKYHNPDNIIHLCNSCHKKFDYAKGERKRRWSRGRATALSQIISIDPDGEGLVYDVQMIGPSHNYLGDGVIHHNNVPHSVAYSMLAFWCMWLKVHYPFAFYCAQLRKTDAKKWMPLIRDAEEHGVPILGVRPDLSGRTWRIAEDAGADGAPPGASRRVIVAGWEQLKGVGPAKVDAIEAYIELHGAGALQHADDLLNIRGIGPKTIEGFRHQLDSSDPFGLRRVGRVLDELREDISFGNIPLPAPTHISDQMYDLCDRASFRWMGFVREINYQDYIENRRSRYGYEVEDIIKGMKRPDLVTSVVLRCYDDGKEDVYVRINRFQYPRYQQMIEDLTPHHHVIYVKGTRFGGQESFGISVGADKVWVLEADSA